MVTGKDSRRFLSFHINKSVWGQPLQPFETLGVVISQQKRLQVLAVKLNCSDVLTTREKYM
jgi:hypothetical protein